MVRRNQTTESSTDSHTPQPPLLSSSSVPVPPSSRSRAFLPSAHNHQSKPLLVSPRLSALLLLRLCPVLFLYPPIKSVLARTFSVTRGVSPGGSLRKAAFRR